MLTSLVMAIFISNTHAQGQCDNQQVIDIGGMGITGSTNLCVTAGGVKARMRVHGLQPGHAYTI